MGMPTLLPSKALMYQVEYLTTGEDHVYNEHWEGCAPSRPGIRRIAPWMFRLCGWRCSAYLMEWSSFYRYPYYLLFESIAHLTFILKAMPLSALWELSARMRTFDTRLRASEIKF